jgi:very-short-patch-repair endonuclease
MAPRTPLRRALDVASQQYGVIGRQQILDCGLTTRQVRQAVRADAFDAIHRAVFRVVGSAPSWHQRLMAATLAGGPAAVASHRAAGALYLLDGFEQDIIEITLFQDRRMYVPPHEIDVVVHRTSILDERDRTTVGCIPTMTPLRLLICLGAVVPRKKLVHALDTAERRGLVHRADLVRELGDIRASGRNGVRMISDVLERRERLGSLPWTVLERTLLDAVRAAGLPIPETQYPFARPASRKAFLDFAWVMYKLAVEADGGIAHALPEQRRSDYSRDRDVQRGDWRILRFTYEEIMYETAKVVDELRDHLRSRGATF